MKVVSSVWCCSLFSSIPTDALSRPTIKTLMALYDNYVADASIAEVEAPAKMAEKDAFLNAIMATQVIKDAHKFLVSKGLYTLKKNMINDMPR